MSRPWYPHKLTILAAILLLAALFMSGCGTSRTTAIQKTVSAETIATNGITTAGREPETSLSMSAKGGASPENPEGNVVAKNDGTSLPEEDQTSGKESAPISNRLPFPSGADSSTAFFSSPASSPLDSNGGLLAPTELIPRPSDEFPKSLEAVTGLFTYYSQTDERWANSLFGTRDPILTHGCGPTVLAMLVSSYTSTQLDPSEAATWAAQNRLCIPGDGSSHAIIKEGCKAFGLSAVSLPQHTPEAISKALETGSVVVALMGRGYFTDSGHFIIIIKALDDGKVRIADPANLEHCRADWPMDLLISQLKTPAYSGGPLWSVGYAD